MDIKLKKFKGIISFICISLSVLILTSLVSFTPIVLRNWQSVLDIVKNAPKDSYLESTFVDEIVTNAVNNSFVQFDETNRETYYYLNQLALDNNMYLELRKSNVLLLKSTHTDIKNEGISTKLPDEYSSLYIFKNGKLEHRLGDNVIDIYGDNVYNNGELRVPGYANYAANENQLKVELLIAFKTNPISYLETDDNFYGSHQAINSALSESTAIYQDDNAASEASAVQKFYPYDYYSIIYNAKQMFDSSRAVFAGIIIGMVLVLSMLVLGCVFYPHKKLVDAFIARLTKYIPFEIKLFCIGIGVLAWIQSNRYFFDWAVFGISLPLTVVAIWLLANDNKYNKPIYKQSVLCVAYKALALPHVKQGVYRKLIRLIILVAVVYAIGVFCVIMVLACFINREFMQALIFAFIGGNMGLICLLSVMEIVKIGKNTGDLLTYLQQLSNGDKVQMPIFKSCAELEDAATQLNNLEQSLHGSVTKQMQAERMKIELIANVSHDIKTPLTSVISYIDLLKEEAELPQHVKEYITVLDEKSQRLKNMVQDIFEVSKAASGQLAVNIEKLDLCRLIRQTLADAQDSITNSGMIICESLPSEPCEIMADGDKMYRVYQNLVSNALKYSLKGSRIHINLEQENGVAIVSIKNVSAEPIDNSVDFTQRFVRGDDSRTDGGSGLGLSIASSFTAACGGKFSVTVNADMFSAHTEFNII